MIEKLRTTYLAKTQVPCQKYTTTKLKGALRDYGTISQSFAEDIRYIVNSDWNLSRIEAKTKTRKHSEWAF